MATGLLAENLTQMESVHILTFLELHVSAFPLLSVVLIIYQFLLFSIF